MTFLLYLIGSYTLLSAPMGFAHSSAGRIAAVVSDEPEFRSRYATLETFNFGTCYHEDVYPGDKFIDKLYALDLKPAGFDFPRANEQCHYMLQCPDKTPLCVTLVHTDWEGFFNSPTEPIEQEMYAMGILKERYTAILNALDYISGRPSEYDFWANLWHPARAGLALVLAFVLLAISTVSTAPRSASARFNGPTLDWFNFVTWSPAWLRRLDKKMLKTRPNAWAMRSHMLMVSSFVLTAILAGGVFVYTLITGEKLIQNEANLPFVAGGFVFLGAMSALLCILYRLKYPITLSEKSAVRRYILSFYKPFLPVLLTLCLLIMAIVILKELTDVQFVFGIEVRDINDAAGSLFLFLICFSAGQSFAISLFIALRFFPNIASIIKVIATLAIPAIVVGVLVFIDTFIDEFGLWYLGFVFITILVVVFGLSRWSRNEKAALLNWVMVFPVCFLVAIAMVLISEEYRSDFMDRKLWQVVTLFVFQGVLVFGPVLLVRFFSQSLQECILRAAAAPRKV